jgi:putative Ca2+/H+ antiporter (TMEM165/GDT1 family)
MGDKTQFFAMSLATRYKFTEVLFAIFLATVLNFGIMVVLGQFLTTLVPIYIITLAASVSFIGFGLWTLIEKEPKIQTAKASKFGIIGAIIIPFFVAEFGDKTQLTTISLAAEYKNALSVLIGATLAMIIADGIGIGVGVFMGKHMPEKTINWISATIFIAFGLIGIYEVLSAKIGLSFTALSLAFAIALSLLIIWRIRKQNSNTQING